MGSTLLKGDTHQQQHRNEVDIVRGDELAQILKIMKKNPSALWLKMKDYRQTLKSLVTLEARTDDTRTSTQRGIMIHTPLPNHVIDNDGVRVLQQARQFHGNLGKPHARAAKDLHSI